MKQSFRSVLIAEIVRFVTAQKQHRVLYHEDIDLTKMNNLAKVEEEQHKNRYLSWRQQKAGKSDGEFSLYTHLLKLL
jgi:hypothetical protein